jgi:hypothetical protein
VDVNTVARLPGRDERWRLRMRCLLYSIPANEATSLDSMIAESRISS